MGKTEMDEARETGGERRNSMVAREERENRTRARDDAGCEGRTREG